MSGKLLANVRWHLSIVAKHGGDQDVLIVIADVECLVEGTLDSLEIPNKAHLGKNLHRELAAHGSQGVESALDACLVHVARDGIRELRKQLLKGGLPVFQRINAIEASEGLGREIEARAAGERRKAKVASKPIPGEDLDAPGTKHLRLGWNHDLPAIKIDRLELEQLTADKLANRSLDAIQAADDWHNWCTKAHERLEVAQCLGILAAHEIARGGSCGMEELEEVERFELVALRLVLGKLPPKMMALGGRIMCERRTYTRNPIENGPIIQRGTSQLGPVVPIPATDHIVDRGRGEAFVVEVSVAHGVDCLRSNKSGQLEKKVSAWCSRAKRERCESLGIIANPFLGKPF